MEPAKKSRHHWKLATLLTLFATMLVVAAVAAVTSLSIRREQRSFRSELRQQAELMLAALATVAADPLYYLDTDQLTGLAAELAKVEMVTAVRFYDAGGRLLADSALPQGVASVAVDPLGTAVIDHGADLFVWEPDRLLAGRSVVVAGQRFGALSLALSTAQLEAKVATVRDQGLLVAGGAALLGLALALLLNRWIVAPVQSLARSTREVAAGDLDQTVAGGGTRELAELAESFTVMVGRLKAARDDLRRSYDGLEERVAERTRELSEEVRERRRAEADLQQAKEAAELAARVKSEFVANMSHEIRTPLNAVIGVAQLLAREELRDVQRDYVETIHTSADTLLRLIDGILDFSKLDSRKLEVESVPFDLRGCVEDALDLVVPRAAAKGLELVADVDETCPRDLFGDRNRLSQVLLNLLGNGVKFTHAGEVTLAAQPVGDEIRFTVRDTGIGMTPEEASRVFEPFTQADASMTRRYGGTGLGLAITRQLVELMGGTIRVDSRPGEGSTFHFTLAARPASARTYGGEGVPSLHGKRLLILDEHARCREVLARRLAAWKASPATATAVPEALERLRQGERFDAGLIDFRILQRGGRDLARAWRDHGTGTAPPPLVLMHYLGERNEVAAAADDDGLFAAFLTKPVRLGRLHDVLVRLLAAGPPAGDADVPAPGEARALSLLVAEDNPVNQLVLRRMLETLGHQVAVVGNGREAVEAVERGRYDAVLLDVQMPTMDGLEAARHICRRWPPSERPRLIAVTAHVSAQDRENCLQAGMDEYVSKPVQRELLAAVLAREVA